MQHFEREDDATLLTASVAEPEAFAAFYRRHLPLVLRWLHRHVRNRELAADLAGEVFASALRARRDFDPERGSAAAWLQTIARNILIDSIRRGQVEDNARRALGIASLTLTDDDLARVHELIDQSRGETPATDALARLPAEQRDAVVARILDESAYGDIAHGLRCSPAVARQRVSRGLRKIRAGLEQRP
jgi:RNA polymerase sigma-70 factor (ECF subfamily)